PHLPPALNRAPKPKHQGALAGGPPVALVALVRMPFPPASPRGLLSCRATKLQWHILFATARSERQKSAQECHDGDFLALHGYDLRLAALVLRAPLCPMPINAQGSIAIPARKSVDKARMPRDLRAQTGAILPLVATKRCAPRDVVPVQGGSWRGNRCGNADAAIRTARRAGPAGYVPRAMEPQPPQVQRMRWQTRCVPSTTQRAGTKRHTRQVKADRHPR